MRWWSGLGFGVGIALLVQAGCGGRSTRQDASEGGGTDAGSNGAGRFGADAGSAAGPGAGKGGAEAAPNGELEYDECDGVARQSPFCNRVFASCPPELDEARRLPRFCERDVTNLEYSECDGYVRLEFV